MNRVVRLVYLRPRPLASRFLHFFPSFNVMYKVAKYILHKNSHFDQDYFENLFKCNCEQENFAATRGAVFVKFVWIRNECKKQHLIESKLSSSQKDSRTKKKSQNYEGNDHIHAWKRIRTSVHIVCKFHWLCGFLNGVAVVVFTKVQKNFRT